MTDRYQKSIDYVKALHGELDTNSEVVAQRDILKQMAVLYGLGSVAEITSRSLDYAGVYEKRREAGRKIVEAIQTSNALAQGDLEVPYPRDHVEDFATWYNWYGLNFSNKFDVYFRGNSAITEEQISLLGYYCIEIQQPGEEIQTERLDLGFSQNIDASEINYPAFSFTFLLDRRMIVHNAIRQILSKMKNKKTGRYGYKQDYMFEEITIFSMDGLNTTHNLTKLKNCVISGAGELGRAKSNTDFQTIQLSIEYDNIETF